MGPRSNQRPEPGRPPRASAGAPRAITVEVGFELGDLPQRPLRQQTAHREEVPVPAPVVEDAEQPLLLLRQLDQRLRFGQIQGERLVDHHVLARQQGLASDGGVGVVGGRSPPDRGCHRPAPAPGCRPGCRATRPVPWRHPGSPPSAGSGPGSWPGRGVKGLSCEAVSHQGGVDCVAHPVSPRVCDHARQARSPEREGAQGPRVCLIRAQDLLQTQAATLAGHQHHQRGSSSHMCRASWLRDPASANR